MPSDALGFGVNDRPAEALDKLRGGVIVIEIISANELVNRCSAVWALALLDGHDDSCHKCLHWGSYHAVPLRNRAYTQLDGSQT